MPKNPRETAILYAEARLEPWGRWSRDYSESLGLPKTSMIHKIMRRKLVRGPNRTDKKVGKLTAKGKETLSFRPRVVGEASEAIAEVDLAVAVLPQNLQRVLKVEYIDYRNVRLEDRCAAAGLARRRYGQLLECAKYSVFVLLESGT